MFAAQRHASVTRNLQRTLALSRSSNPRFRRVSPSLPHRRTLWITALDPLKENFLDLAVALPWPETFPPYVSTIILTTVISRLFVTLPFSIWARKRKWRLEEQLVPELTAYRREAAIKIAEEMKFAGYGKRGIEEFRKIHLERLSHALVIRRKELSKKYSCSPTLTNLIPVVSQLPLFIFLSGFFLNVAQRPTPLDDEAFLTLTSLARPDPTGTLPVMLGLVTFANVETAKWFVGAERAARAAAIEERREKEDARVREEGGTARLRLGNVTRSSLRGLSVFRIVVGITVDGSVIVYWLTSATFGLIQSWAFNWWDARRAARQVQLNAQLPQQTTRRQPPPHFPIPKPKTPKPWEFRKTSQEDSSRLSR